MPDLTYSKRKITENYMQLLHQIGKEKLSGNTLWWQCVKNRLTFILNETEFQLKSKPLKNKFDNTCQNFKSTYSSN